MIMDAGPAAAIMLAIQAVCVLKILVLGGDWDTRNIDRPSIGDWEPRIHEAMLRRPNGGGSDDLRWRDNCLVVYARYPDGLDNSARVAVPAVSMLRSRGADDAGVEARSRTWILIADDSWICLGRFGSDAGVARELGVCGSPVATEGRGAL